jgi:predicted dehydrogenase
MTAFLELVRAGKVSVKELITDRVAVTEAPEAYERLVSSDQSPLAILIEYPTTQSSDGEPMNGRSSEKSISALRARPSASTLAVGVIGAGSFAQRILIPGLKEAGFDLVSVASEGGVSAQAAAERFGFGRAATVDEVIGDATVDLIAIATRHSSHARLAAAALRAGKSVFVEKPPCLSFDELKDLRAASQESDRLLMVGFNRRHAPLAKLLREELSDQPDPLSAVYRVSAGALPADHWLNDIDEGGGRLLGEGCHFVDFACLLAGSLPERLSCSAGNAYGQFRSATNSFTIVMDFPGGSSVTIIYTPAGSPDVGKEYAEAHAGATSLLLDDFRSLEVHRDGRARRIRRRGHDKGHAAQFEQLRRVLSRVDSPDDLDPLDTMAWTLRAAASARTGRAQVAKD